MRNQEERECGEQRSREAGEQREKVVKTNS
jgi:hypothetical protein